MSYIGDKPSQTLASPTSQYFNGDGSTVAFTLNRPVNVSEDLEVFVNNVQQEPGVGKSYTATGTTLTFDAAPSSGTANVYVVYRGLAEVTTRLEHDANAALAATTGTFSGDLTVDTDTLYVDSTNNKVGVNTVSPSSNLTVYGTGINGGIKVLAPTNTSLLIESENNTTGAFMLRSQADEFLIFNQATSGLGTGGAFIKYTEGSHLRLMGDSYILSTGGITFNGDTATANALDDYEEGTCTITATAATTAPTSPATQTGYYTKIGNMVTLWCDLNNINMSGAAGNLRITGLPFGPSGNAGNKVGPAYTNHFLFQNTSVEQTVVVETSGAGNDWLNLRVCRSDNNAATLVTATSGYINNGVTDVRFTICYKVN